ncbi:MAG: putative paraquat-inducible protein A [Saprospiraceae bacterium]|jgi:uncharacterized paraquat-inducible protein A
MFSIVVPFIKLVLSSAFLYSNKIRNNKLAKGIIYHLGKWSMADVFVVAMFMAYIGFYGIITSQLGDIGRNQTGYAVETLIPFLFDIVGYYLVSSLLFFVKKPRYYYSV